MSTAQPIMEMLQTEMSSVVGLSIARLVLAAILGGFIGLEREVKHRSAGLRTNMFICFGAALFTILSDQLAAEHTGDHTRIAAQIIPGIGFIGAGSILHAQGRFITGLTTAATLFVVASIGMAVGGGLYLTAVFATGVIVICLFLLGKTEQILNLKLLLNTYEVAGRNADEITAEVNRILETNHSMMKNVQVADTKEHVRVQFELAGKRKEQEKILRALRQSSLLESVTPLGPVEPE
jgi:putative Mg2+ transporter-C (MgtC) family protein